MRETIEKIAKGLIEYETPLIDLSVPMIERKLGINCVHEDSFEITTGNIENLKGVLYSTHDDFVLLDRQFTHQNNRIHYKIDTSHYNEGDRIEGNIHIVSNGGEMDLPFNIQIQAVLIDSSIGLVRNLFHFTNLVQMNHEEALKIFCSRQFPQIFLSNDNRQLALYQGLAESPDKESALEEFLIAINKKRRIELSLSVDEKIYEELDENYGDLIEIKKDAWGYTRIEVDVIGDFLNLERTKLTSDDFAGNCYEFRYQIDTDQLHAGKNWGMIIFKTASQTLTCRILASKKQEIRRGTHAKRIYMNKLLSVYFQFRKHEMSLEDWVSESEELLKEQQSADQNNFFVTTALAQFALINKKNQEASILLDKVAEGLIDLKENYIKEYCYYLYVRTLQKRDPAFTAEVMTKITDYYNQGNDDWQILWLLLFLDEKYEYNKSLQWNEIKEQFLKGCRSPVLFLEACELLNEQPDLLHHLSNYEITILLSGCGKGYISRELALQTAQLSLLLKKYHPHVLRLLEQFYQEYEEDTILTAICSLLIKGNKTQESYFHWYELAIEKDIKLTRLYEYYLNSAPTDYSGLLPQTVLMYFIYNNSLDYKKQTFLYCNVIRNRALIPALYRSYFKQIEQFALQQLELGHIDDQLALLYQTVLTKSMLDSRTACILPDVVRTFRITCENPNMTEVIVIHKELEEVQRTVISDGTAYVHLYTEDPVVILLDKDGNRYARSISYVLDRILELDEYLNICQTIVPQHQYLALYFTEKYLSYRNNPTKSVDIFKRVTELSSLRVNFRKQIMHEIIEYYSDNYDGDILDEYLANIDMEELEIDTRTKVFDLMIVRGLYQESAPLLLKYGYMSVSPGRLVKFATRMLQLKDYEEDSFLLAICGYVFRKGKYNDAILQYLGKYFYGTSKEMFDLWKASKDFTSDCRELEERLVVQVIFTRSYLSNIMDVYRSYLDKGASEKVKAAFYNHKCYEFFVQEKMIDTRLFLFMEKEFDHYDELSDLMKIAYLKYCSELENLSQDQIVYVQKMLYEITAVNKVFQFFKKLSKWIRVPYPVIDTTVIEYRTNPKNRVWIHYIIDAGSSEKQSYIIEEMQCEFHGVFVKPFILFYGETLLYYITEELEEAESLTESSSYQITERELYDQESRFGLLNDMMICREVSEDVTGNELARAYVEKDYITKHLVKNH